MNRMARRTSTYKASSRAMTAPRMRKIGQRKILCVPKSRHANMIVTKTMMMVTGTILIDFDIWNDEITSKYPQQQLEDFRSPASLLHEIARFCIAHYM